MTTTQFWQRQLMVSYDGLTVSAPRIGIRVAREVAGKPTSGYVRLYNLSPDTVRRFDDVTRSLTLEGGYGDRDNIGLLFAGGIHQARQSRKGLDNILEISLIDRSAGADAVIQLSYEGATTVRTIVRDIAVAMGLALSADELALVPSDELDSWSENSSARQVLTRLLSQYPVDWYEEDGQLKFLARTGKPTGHILYLSPSSGLLETPVPEHTAKSDTATQSGLRVKSLLNPGYRLGDRVILDSRDYQGEYYIASLTHIGDNWTGHFRTELALKVPEASNGQS